jgi:VWFA-related protein
MSRMHSRLGLCSIWLFGILLAPTVSAQQAADSQTANPQSPAPQATTTPPPPQSPATPDNSPAATFRSRTDLVLVPVVVRDHKGNHLPGLAKDAFRLQENGKEQTISVFEEVHPPAADAKPYLTPDRGYSNLPFDNARELRYTILVLDLLNTSIFQRADAKDNLSKFLAKGVTADQPVSLLCITSKGLKQVQPFSTDPKALIETLKNVDVGPESIMARPNRVIGAINQIRDIAQAYAGIPGRKTLIFAAGFMPELTSEAAIIPTSPYAGDLRRMWAALNNSNIAVYTFLLMDWSRNNARGAVSRLDLHMRDFAESTGGGECVEANGLMNCLDSAVEDSRSYYMLGFSVQADDRKPGWRDLKVKVSAEHVDVHARDGFYYGQPSSPTPPTVHDQEINALASTVPLSAIPMFVKVLPPAATDAATEAAKEASTEKDKKKTQFLMTIPLAGVSVDPTQSNPLDLEVGAIALTRDTREAAEFLHPVRGNPKPEIVQAWARDGIKLQAELDLPPGSYDLRFFARDNNTGQIGTVVFPLDVK